MEVLLHNKGGTGSQSYEYKVMLDFNMQYKEVERLIKTLEHSTKI